MSFGESLRNIPADALASRFEAERYSGERELRAPYNANDGPYTGGYRRFIGAHSEALRQLLDTVEVDAKKRMPSEQAEQTVSYVETALLSLCTYMDSLKEIPNDPPLHP